MSEAQKRAVDVGATLAKWGISGAGFIATCGVDGGNAVLGMTTDLANEFSGSKLGMPLGKIGINGIDKIAKKAVIGGAVKLGHKGVDLLATRIKGRLS
ncbi:MAG: hypothetical protein IKV11_00315 [Alphaproteobacteria bacterium]|nr:hypothetical protein [Alphaproteobacteria bacterium]